MAFFGIYLRFLGCIVLISHMAQSYHTRSFLGKALPSPTWIAWGAPERGFRPTPSISVLLPSCLDSPSWTFPFTFRSDNSHFPPKNKNNGTTVIQWSFLVPSVGGKWYLYIYIDIITQLAIYKWYISSIYCQLVPPIKGTRNSYWVMTLQKSVPRNSISAKISFRWPQCSTVLPVIFFTTKKAQDIMVVKERGLSKMIMGICTYIYISI